MSESYLIDININDDLRDVIRKCNHNFRLASLSQVQRSKSFVREMDTMDVDIVSAADAASSAQASANAAQNSANAAGAAAAQAISDAATAQRAADAAQADATAAGTAADAAQASANAAQHSAANANEYASRALGNLSTVQSVAETLAWISEHGTMTPTTDTVLDPTHVYFVADPDGDYTVGGTTYSLVVEPDAADLSSYYELSIDESLNNYVGTHLALTDDGLWLLPAASGTYKVLVATGAGNVYTTPGTYIINGTGGIIAAFTGNGISFDSGTAFTIGDESAYIHFDGDGHINIGGTGITIGGNVSLTDLLHKYDATITADDISVTKTGTTATITVGSETVTISDGAKGDKGDTGATGAQGVSVSSIVHQYYLSTSSSSQAGGSWTVTPADYVAGRYYWERWLITFSDGSTAYTEATLAKEVTSAWTAIESNSEQIALKANSTDVYTKAQTDGLISQEVTDRNAAITASADSITSTVAATYATKTESYQSAQPNLTPWFSAGCTVPDAAGYWHTLLLSNYTSGAEKTDTEGRKVISAMDDGWAHVIIDSRSSAGNQNKNAYINTWVKLGKLADIVPGGTYTWLAEVRNMTWVGASDESMLTVCPSIGRATLDKLSTSNVAAMRTNTDAVMRTMVVANDDLSEVTQDTRGYMFIPTGCYAEFDVRVSLYAGEYAGPYKPFSDASLSSKVATNETRITQTEADVTTAITGVNGLKALVRQYGQGVLVCRKGNTIGALVNASGSFDIVSVTWDGDTPTAGTVLTSLGSSTLELAKNNQNASIKMFKGKASISALDMLRAGAAFGMQASEVALKGTSSFYLQGGVHPKNGGLGNIVSIYNDGGNALIDSLKAPFEDDGSYPISGSYLSRILVHGENGIFLRPGVKGKVYISEPNEVGGGWSVNRRIRAQPDTLYNNASGSNGTITLSKSSANYTHMRIYFRTDDGTAYQTAKDVYYPNGKYVPLSAATTVQGQNQTWLKTRLVKISGTSITTDTTRYANTNVTYYSEFQKTNLIYIIHVEAWNE